MTFKQFIESKFLEKVNITYNSSSITSAVINVSIFRKSYKLVDGSRFMFTFDSEEMVWVESVSQNAVNLNDIGITITGNPANADYLVVDCVRAKTYKVYEEIKHDNETPDRYIIINAVGGDNVYNSGQLSNYSLTIRSVDPLETLADLMQFATENSGKYFSKDFETTIKLLCNMPYKSQAFQEANDKYYTEFILPVFLIITTNVDDIKEVQIDGEILDVQTANLGYATQVDNQRKDGNELNVTNITLSNLQLVVTAIVYSNIVNAKIRNIMFGHISKDTTFTIKLTFLDDTSETLSMKLTSCTQNKERSTLPTRTYTFMK